MKQTKEIESLLTWAYRDELSKRQCSSAEGIWDRLEEAGQLGGIGDDGRRGDTGAQRYDFGLPHPDAERIEAAVSALPNLVFDWKADGARIAPDLAGLMADRDILSVGSFRTSALVTMHAVMGTRPDWYDEQPRPHMIMAIKGPYAMIVGECKGRNLYTAGSYCPLRYEPSPMSIMQARAEYVAWHSGLVRLAETLQLVDFTPLPPAAAALPWMEDREPRGEVIRMPEKERARALPLKPDRGRAGPRKSYPKAGPVRMVLSA